MSEVEPPDAATARDGGEASDKRTPAPAPRHAIWHAINRASLTARLALGILAVGLIAGGFGIVFRALLELAWHAAGRADTIVAVMLGAPWWVRIAAPAVGGLIAGLLVRVAAARKAGGAGGAGVGDVIEAVALGRVRLSMVTALVRAAASWFAIVSGGSLGREGPLIQFGGTAGDDVGEWLGLSLERRRILIAAGTAAGFASAYNTPLAAVVFVLEVIAGVVVFETVVPTLIATVIATVLTRAALDAGPIYGVRAFTLADPRELFAFVALGVVCAVVAFGFVRLTAAAALMFRRPWLRAPWRQASGGLGAGLVIAVLPLVAGNGYEPLNAVLDGALPIGVVAWVVIAKALATSSSASSGTPGGVFTPSLLLGGCTGFLFGAGLAALGLDVGPPGGYALVGMACAVAATTHAPLMAAVLAFELSGDYAVVLPLVLATAVAAVLAKLFDRHSIYTAELRDRGVTWQPTVEVREIAPGEPGR